jgi:hypothetical protein
MDDPEYENEEIEDGKERIARRRAWLDQRKKQFEDQYPVTHPRINQMRLEDLEAWEFRLEVDEWELNQRIQNLEEEEGGEG